ncbi:MAG: DUF932 domain-containing protein [Lentisphaeria bacterium]|nr:DUF932 domain-containing protein [Lentisphaeria bacterium]
MSLMMCDGKFVGRDEIANVPTPEGTASWHPVAHADVIDAVTEVVKAHNWEILDEQYGLAREGQRMFGVMRINKSSSPEWSRCIGIRNSHDQSLAVGLAAGVSVMCCSNLAFGGTMVLHRRHTSRIELGDLVVEAVEELEMEFLNLETVSEDLKLHEVRPDEARAVIVRAAEIGAVNSCDIVPIFREFQKPCHEEFAEPTRWSLLNAFTEHAKKYSPGRADVCYRGLTRLFGLDGNRPELWTR